mmetsp:Transcript_24278/g.34262  ORF Transcript_24278/g.34262 Transcript_24278/m.34262 type:complete len:493 (-) Transcript_24278:370-1848(-)|eukprot:CAMPEP_0175097116 /NCGR_PEP_ID=MMETSP0086_2-20121207/5105_1 /TAXON_ID=136419 /ORGANISM="Unknown Unknown, Strain D1" /LENGTH=492 /DNA_ID=CAMNT_0016370585 /DNA_START=22 /DNA_END=1500 /DNA_ORIENTATION=+
METVVTSRRERLAVGYGKDNAPFPSGSQQQKQPLSMYTEPPSQEITLTQLETLGLARLRILKALENAKAVNMPWADQQALVAEKEKELFNKDSPTGDEDKISHFILRLVYCRSEELRRWFLSQEVTLFRLRFTQNVSQQSRFMAQYGLQYQSFDPVREPLVAQKLRGMKTGFDKNDEYYKVPFMEALELVGSRKVYLAQGFAYVSHKNIVSIIAAKFRAHLSEALATFYRTQQNLKQDPRIGRLLSGLQYKQAAADYKVTRFSGSVTKAEIPMLSERSFPLCMQHLTVMLKKENHLKHGGRMQFGLFLKGIGLSLNDALVFWREQFSRRTPPDKFNKEYAYNIRHNYGKEGKRTSYTPYGCLKIIQGAPAPGDHHGCPFRHFDEQNLKSKLRSKRVGKTEIDEITELVKGMHYQVACQKYFSATHNGHVGENVGNHPNAYFDDSVAYYKNQEGDDGNKDGKTAIKDETAVKTETVSADIGDSRMAAPKPVTA